MTIRALPIHGTLVPIDLIPPIWFASPVPREPCLKACRHIADIPDCPDCVAYRNAA